MGDSWTCPECGATAVIATDGRSFCQGPKISDDLVRETEQELKTVVSLGQDHLAADIAWRKISAQKVCGAVMYQDGNGVWRRVVPAPGV